MGLILPLLIQFRSVRRCGECSPKMACAKLNTGLRCADIYRSMMKSFGRVLAAI